MKKKSVVYAMADMTNPYIIDKLGLKRKGNQVVFEADEDGPEEVYFEYTPEEMVRVEQWEVK